MNSQNKKSILKLVGGLQLGNNSWDLDSFGILFNRLAKEVKHTGNLSRYIRYESIIEKPENVRFFGIEVENIENIPEGMVGLDIGSDNLTILEPGINQDIITWQSSLTWQWLDKSASGRTVGDFKAECPSDWNSGTNNISRSFNITANAYVDPNKIGFDDEINLVEYNNLWSQKYKEMQSFIYDTLGDIALRVEHYGSTAIPGMSAKPIIDVLVEIPSFSKITQKILPIFNVTEWEYWEYSNHIILIKREQLMGTRTHHIHLAPAGHDIWKGILFRDYLRNHNEDALQYMKLKSSLAEIHKTDRERYTQAKSQFIEEIMLKAMNNT